MGKEDNKTDAREAGSAAGNAKRLSDDARSLGPMRVGMFAVGHVDKVVGEGGTEVPGFVPTKNELLQLVRYWATEIIDVDWFHFAYASTGPSEWRTREFANRRLNTISQFIGEEEVKKA